MSIEPVPDFEAAEIKSIRNELGMTQVLFAGFMGVSTKTVEAWESGRNMPNGPARRILTMLKADPALPQRLNIIAK
ncbi:MAG: helix-turn-helix domain-containing protein [Ruminococcaceae bacterium]|nr:helix-turn-helix domain-containing protein [Oscillospiraceae bacterium]